MYFKTSSFFSVIFLLGSMFFIFCSEFTKDKHAIITGTITNPDSVQLWISKPVNDYIYYDFEVPLELSENGHFSTKVNVDEVTIVSISEKVQYESYRRHAFFTAEAGKNYEITIDNSGDTSLFQVNGDPFFCTLNNLLNEKTSYGAYKEFSFEEAMKQAKLQHDKEMDLINQLAQQKKLSESSAELIRESARQKLALATFNKGGSEIYKLKYRDTTTDHSTRIETINRIIQDQVESFDLSSKLTGRSKDFYYLIDRINGIKIDKHFTEDDIEKLREDKKLRLTLFNFLKKLDLGDNAPAVLASHISSDMYFLTPDNLREFLAIVESYKDSYPESDFDFYIDSLHTYLLSKKEQTNSAFSSEFVFLNDSEKETLDDLWQKLKGDKWYVDMWATWCGPCRNEFAFIGDIEDTLDKYGYKKLYISTDKPKDKEKWLNSIKYYDLKGYHMLVTREMWKELGTMVTSRKLNTIPRYFLLDEEGKIMHDDAARPSAKDKMLEQIMALNN